MKTRIITMKSEGICKYCNKGFSGQAMTRHILSCTDRKNKLAKEQNQDFQDKVFLIRANDGPFFLYFEASATSTLKDMDSFLRDIWLECCGHLSLFKIENVNYDSGGSVEIFDGNKSKTMDAQLRKVLKVNRAFEHEYDFGSTTHLDLKVISERQGGLKNIDIIARNNMPDFKCECGKPAKEICAECVYEGKGLLCEECAKNHNCEEEMLLPLVNSPRTGVCGYTGD